MRLTRAIAARPRLTLALDPGVRVERPGNATDADRHPERLPGVQQVGAQRSDKARGETRKASSRNIHRPNKMRLVCVASQRRDDPSGCRRGAANEREGDDAKGRRDGQFDNEDERQMERLRERQPSHFS
jgi:hypothetical protein